MSEERDLLIELKTDIKYIREGVESLRKSDIKQWEKLDAQGKQISGQKSSLAHLIWGVRLIAGTVATICAGAWHFVHKN